MGLVIVAILLGIPISKFSNLIISILYFWGYTKFNKFMEGK